VWQTVGRTPNVLGYRVSVRKAPDGYYIGGCPDLPEVHTQGKSRDECLARLREAIELSLEVRKDEGNDVGAQSTIIPTDEEISPYLLRQILKQIGVTEDEFLDALKK